MEGLHGLPPCPIPRKGLGNNNNNNNRIFKVEIRIYFNCLVYCFYFKAQFVAKQCSNAFAKFNRSGTNVLKGQVRI